MTAPSLFTEELAPNPDACTRAGEFAGERWTREAREWIDGYLRTHLWLEGGDAQREGCPVPPTTWRALGAVYRWAIVQGLMVEDGTCRRPNGTLAARYRSLIRGAA